MKLLCVLLTVGFAVAQTAIQPAPQYDSPSSPAGTLGSYCSSLQGLTTLLSPNQTSNVAGFNVTVPSSISSSPAQLGALANVRMHLCYARHACLKYAVVSWCEATCASCLQQGVVSATVSGGICPVLALPCPDLIHC